MSDLQQVYVRAAGRTQIARVIAPFEVGATVTLIGYDRDEPVVRESLPDESPFGVIQTREICTRPGCPCAHWADPADEPGGMAEAYALRELAKFADRGAAVPIDQLCEDVALLARHVVSLTKIVRALQNRADR